MKSLEINTIPRYPQTVEKFLEYKFKDSKDRNFSYEDLFVAVRAWGEVNYTKGVMKGSGIGMMDVKKILLEYPNFDFQDKENYKNWLKQQNRL